MDAGLASISDFERFCRTVRQRSVQHQEAMALLEPSGLLGVQITLLRQELDSMIRVIYLCEQELVERARLLALSSEGERWFNYTARGKKDWITDGQMVDLASKLHGWLRRVYKFGCAFIHLSDVYDYASTDPFQRLPVSEREEIVGYLNYYHDVDLSVDCTFEDVARCSPAILRKIRSNLQVQLEDLSVAMCAK